MSEIGRQHREQGLNVAPLPVPARQPLDCEGVPQVVDSRPVARLVVPPDARDLAKAVEDREHVPVAHRGAMPVHEKQAFCIPWQPGLPAPFEKDAELPRDTCVIRNDPRLEELRLAHQQHHFLAVHVRQGQRESLAYPKPKRIRQEHDHADALGIGQAKIATPLICAGRSKKSPHLILRVNVRAKRLNFPRDVRDLRQTLGNPAYPKPPEEALQNAPSGLARSRDTTVPEQKPLDPVQSYPADIRLRTEQPYECHERGFTRHKLRTERPAVIDIRLHTFLQVHSTPSRSMSATLRRDSRSTFAYTPVDSRLRCPNKSETSFIVLPELTRCVAKLCRRQCGPLCRGFAPAASNAVLTM